MDEKYLLLRRHIEEIVPLTDEEWHFVQSHFEYRRLKKHQFLVQLGQLVNYEFWIIAGLIRAYTIDEKGKEYILRFAMETYWVSDYFAFQHQLPASIYLDCIEDSEFLCLTFENRETICREVHAMANFFRIKSNYGYINLQGRILSLLTESAEERYETLVNKLPGLIQRVPKKTLAAYLGVSRETLSRLKF